MKNLRLGVLYVSLFAAMLLTGCGAYGSKAEKTPQNNETISLMTWNVNNLFDGKDNGTEYAEYRQASGWSEEKYLGRINAISAAIGKVEPAPDIITLEEVESLDILEQLAESLSGYSWIHFANNPDAPLGLGIVSRFPLTEIKAHSITIHGDTAPRPVLETRVLVKEREFVIFICHWKSKIGKEGATENARKASARVIIRRISELWQDEPGLGVIIAGDLNENHDEFSRLDSKVLSALLPDDPHCAQLAGYGDKTGETGTSLQKDFIIISRNKPPAADYFPEESVVLFSPWLEDIHNGSYYKKNNWETIDHFLISGHFFNNSGLNYKKTEVIDYEPFAVDG
ncbi:MAG: endonuclease/exonuclease/phosphatase family protein, partial [Treponema sp.]|nr:endonuclease/exonuclease/phosphatase family protein [Treponema sp.]